jgi:lipoprotein-releasing system permease protein
MVMEKTKDVAVLISMGAKRRQIRGIFMFQGVLIGVIGTVAGLIVAMGWRSPGQSTILWRYRVSIRRLSSLPRVPDGVPIAAVACLSRLLQL